MSTQKKNRRTRAAITNTKDGDLKLSTFGKSIDHPAEDQPMTAARRTAQRPIKPLDTVEPKDRIAFLGLESIINDTRNMTEVAADLLDDLFDLSNSEYVQDVGRDYVRILVSRRSIDLMSFAISHALMMTVRLHREFYEATEVTDDTVSKP